MEAGIIQNGVRFRCHFDSSDPNGMLYLAYDWLGMEHEWSGTDVRVSISSVLVIKDF